jgi:hypothetical protein
MGLIRRKERNQKPDSPKSQCLQTCAARPSLRDSFQGSCSLSALLLGFNWRQFRQKVLFNLVSSLFFFKRKFINEIKIVQTLNLWLDGKLIPVAIGKPLVVSHSSLIIPPHCLLY